VGTVVTARHTAFIWSPKVLRAGMGAHFALQMYEGLEWSEVAARLPTGTEVRATRLARAESLYQADLRGPGCWVFGNEGQGLAAQFAQANWLTIPQNTAVESLNVAAAAAVCLFEQCRQRARIV
jgi:TrmH family RNA methyltransferase